MLRQTAPRWSMPIRTACRTLGFAAPPASSAVLRQRFVELTKQHHPDLHAENTAEATARMVELTQAYACLKKVLRTSVQYNHQSSAAAASSASSSPPGAVEEWRTVADTFNAPGSGVSLYGFVLPWQRSRTDQNTAALEAKLNDPKTSFAEYVECIRGIEAVQRRRADQVRRDAPMSDGSHGFDSTYFEKVHAYRDAVNGGRSARTTSIRLLALAVIFYGRRARRRLVQAPQSLWKAVRYICLGQ